jgi:O-antigen/teichoic acid export membrane protein
MTGWVISELRKSCPEREGDGLLASIIWNKYTRAERIADSLKSKTLHALSWSFVEAIGLQSVKFVIGIILARLLLPEQFGLVAMLYVFIAVANAFIESGFGAALIQKRNAGQIDICSIFTSISLMGLGLCTVFPTLLCSASSRSTCPRYHNP